MSRSAKISLVIFGVIAVLALIMGILVRTLVTPERIQDTLVPLTEKSLHGKVTLGDIHIGLFSGISLSDLQVQQKTGAAPFVAVKSMDLHYRFLPLLSGKVVIDHISLVQPEIVVTKHPDGSFNFSDLLGNEVVKGTAQPKREQPAVQTGNKAQAPAKKPLNLLVNAVSLSGGHLLFIDQSQPNRPPSRYSLDHLFLEAKQITLSHSFPIDLSASLNGAKITLSGTCDLKGRSANINLELDKLKATDFAPYYQNALPGKLGSGLISISAKASLNPDLIKAKAHVTLDRVDLALKDLPWADMQQAKLEIDSSLSYKTTEKELDISSLVLKFNDIPIRATGKILLTGKEPSVALALYLEDLNLQKLSRDLPAGLAEKIKGYKPAGTVNALAELAGRPSKGPQLLKKADFRLKNVQANLSGIKTGINGKIDFSGQKIHARKLTLSLADQPVEFSFAAKDLFSKHITGEFKVEADTLDFNSLLPGTRGKKTAHNSEKDTSKETGSTGLSPEHVSDAPQSADRSNATPPKELGPFALPAEITGTITVKKGVYKQLPIDHIHAGIILRNNHLKIVKAGCNLAGGTVNLLTDVNLGIKGLAYQGKVDLSKIQLDEINNGLFPDSGQSITGTLDTSNTFSGHGTSSPGLLKALQVNGKTFIKDGHISGSPLLISLADFLGNINLEKVSFTTIQSLYTMQNGVISLKGALDSERLKLNPEGTIAIDGPLDLGLNARLSPGLMARLGSDNTIKQALTDENGWGLMPLKLTGTMQSPMVALDSKAIQKQAIGKAKQELQKQLLKKLSSDSKDGKEKSSNQQLLDSALKGLFGN